MTAMPQMKSALDNRTLANALRMLAIDAVEQAKSGHPGAPMGLADIAQVLWNRYLKHNPADPRWPDRDRFILSNGHSSMLLYALLHLSGYDVPLDELKRFRQLHSKTPGHPEVGVTPGSKRQPDRLGRALRMRSARLSPRSFWRRNSTGRPTRSSTTEPSCSSATAA
jgi:transketolase